MPIPRVYADFNAIESLGEEAHRADMALTGYGTLCSLAQQRLRLTEGMLLVLYEPGDIECEGVAHFDLERRDPAGRMGAWVARINCEDIRDCEEGGKLGPEHPCIACGMDFSPLFEKAGRSYKEQCPGCGESVMAPLAPPGSAT